MRQVPKSNRLYGLGVFLQSVNLKSIFLCCKAVLPHMIERKCRKIVNTALVSIIDTPANREGDARRRSLPLGFTRRHRQSYPIPYF